MVTGFIIEVITTVTIVVVIVKLMIGFALTSVRGTSPNSHCHSHSDNLLVMSAYLHLLPLLGPVDLLGMGIDPGHFPPT